MSGRSRRHRNVPKPNVLQVAPAVVHEIRTLADPHRLVVTSTHERPFRLSLKPVLRDHAGELSTLPYTRSVSEKEAVMIPRRTGELVALRGVDHRFQLQRGEKPAVDERAGEVKVVEDVGRDDGGESAACDGRKRHSPRLDDGVGVYSPDADLLRRVGVEDTWVVGLGEVHLADLYGLRREDNATSDSIHQHDRVIQLGETRA